MELTRDDIDIEITPPSWVHPELRNIATELDDEELAEIAATVIEDYRRDEESRNEWLVMHSDWLRLYFQKDRPLNPPWEGSSDESVPMLAEACNQFHARAFRAMFPKRQVVRAIPVGASDAKSRERADRVGKHLSWQLTVKNRDYKRGRDRLLLALPLHGSFFTKTYYDPIGKRVRVDNVRPSDFVVPYGTGSRNLATVDRTTEVLRLSLDRCRYLYSQGYFSALPEPESEQDTTEVDRAHDESTGLQDSGYQEGRGARILEQHRLLDLDNDGLAEPYIVWVDTQTERVLRISIRWETDEAGNAVADKEPVLYYTHYTFLENPDGFYGLGFGHLIGPINTAVNKLLRQAVDAGTLATVGNQSGFVDRRIGVKKGEVQLQLGKFIQTETSGDDLRKSIFQMSFPGPNQVLLDAMSLLLGRSDRLATVTEALTGQTEKVMQPTTVLALIEQGLQVFSTVWERVIMSWEDELALIYRLNGKHLDPVEYFSVLDIDGKLRDDRVAREDYAPDLQIQASAQPRETTKREQLARAEAEWQFAAQNPLILNSPLHLREASRRFLDAIGSEAIGEILPDIATLSMPRIDDPMMENMGALSQPPVMPMVFPDQDHMAHIQAHQAALDGPVGSLTEAGRAALNAHLVSHRALLYMAMGAQNGLGGGQPGLGGMASPAGNAGAPGGAQPQVPAGGGLGGGQLLGGSSNPEGAAAGLGGDRGPNSSGQVM